MSDDVLSSLERRILQGFPPKDLVFGPGTGIAEINGGGQKVLVDGRESKINLVIPDKHSDDVSLCEGVFANPSSFLRAHDKVLPSVGLIRFGKVKPVIDGIYAAAEVEIHRDDARSGYSRTSLLNSLKLVSNSFYLEGLLAPNTLPFNPDVHVIHGLYDENAQLRDAFMSIRASSLSPSELLGIPDNHADWDIMRRLLVSMGQRKNLKDVYDRIRNFYDAMTDKSMNAHALFPSALMPDQMFLREVSSKTQSDIDGSLGKALVEAIKKGDFTFKPQDNSGLYTRQMWEVEPLVKRNTQDFARLVLNKKYEEYLDQEFISQWAATRDTHVAHSWYGSNLIGCSVSFGSDGPIIRPSMHAEPFPVVYERMRDNLLFMRETLERTFGDVFLNQGRILHSGERSSKSIGDELEELGQILTGMSLLARDDMHELYDDSVSHKQARHVAASWLNAITRDADMNRNASLYVPITRTTDRNRQIGYIDAGFKAVEVQVNYATHPVVHHKDNLSHPKFKSEKYVLPVLVHRELRVPVEKGVNSRMVRERLGEHFSESQLDEAIRQLSV